VQRDYDFNVTKTELYIEGYCKKCQDEAHKMALEEKEVNSPSKQIETEKTDKKIIKKELSEFSKKINKIYAIRALQRL